MPRLSKSKPKNVTAEEAGVPNDATAYLASLENSDVVERVRCVIQDTHVFKLPPRPTAGGWRGADWTEEVWQGTVKVVERDDVTMVILADKANGKIFAVCPVKEGAVDRCVDSSRYFVLRIENENGRHMFVGVAFNERNDAFDFNTSLEDSARERAKALEPAVQLPGLDKDYSIKEGEKIKVKIGGLGSGREKKKSATGKKGGFALKPSKRDTTRRTG
ncbi:MAG: hypothetical protein SGBAC_010885 [Bacillariaceae sp.]